MACKNEDWCIGLSLRAALEWNDAVVVLLHDCTDQSAAIVEEVSLENPDRVITLVDAGETWFEMQQRNRMLECARRNGATHISIVDCDEVLSANLIPSIRALFERIDGNQVLQLPWVCLARSLDRFYCSGPWYRNWVSCGFLDSPAAHWAAQGVEKYDFHHRHPMGRPCVPFTPVSQNMPAHEGGLMHLQFVSERRLRAKQSLYKTTEVLRWPGRETIAQINAKYNRAVYESDPAKFSTAPCPADWWSHYAPLMKYIDVEREPWQEKRLRELVAAHPGEVAGLDLFGVA